MLRTLIAGTVSAVALTFGTAAGAVDEPNFALVLKEDRFEIRDYAPMIVAEVTRSGERDAAINDGFSPLADYIFGDNAGKADIEMTAPVTQQRRGTEIAMTAPVTQQAAGAETWNVRFVMPKEWTMATLPKPVNPEVRLIEVPAERMAVVRFSGWVGDSDIADFTARLKDFMARKGLTPVGEPVYAFYDPPWTLPFFRRNEIMWRVEMPAAASN